MAPWQPLRLDQLCSRITSGGTPSRRRPEFYAPANGGHLWVKSKELLDRPIATTEEAISDEGLRGSSAKYVAAKSVLVAMYGANVGQLATLTVPATVNQAICALETDPETTNHRWLFYALKHWRPGLMAKAHGAAQQNLNQGLIREFRLPAPDLPIQRKIAAVLAAYDELIENNLRRIEILEEMAQAIYREWFVNFRYTGHESVPLEDSPLGPIPTGWSPKRFDTLFTSRRTNVNPGKHPSTEFAHFSFAAFDAGRVAAADVGADLKSGKLAVEQPSVLLAKLNPRIPRVWLVDPPKDRLAIASSEFLVLVPQGDVPLSYLYSLVSDREFMSRLTAMAGGTSTLEGPRPGVNGNPVPSRIHPAAIR